ncbi:MAG: putative membrane protein [Cenarchaeum symbiont of Oopsacas minuta]|nr:putative membrane protein [Cenarchaeum symbiont of Oopsacas minuta]
MGMYRVFAAKTYIVMAVAVITFSQFIAELFWRIIPTTLYGFFKDIGGVIILASIFIFAFAWFLKARPHNRPKEYFIVIFDVYGQESSIEGMRINFRTHDVAWSYMKQYKKAYPLYNFAMVADGGTTEKKTIFKYI